VAYYKRGVVKDE